MRFDTFIRSPLALARLDPLGAVRSSELLLRLSLGLVYLWFGALKIAGASPALDIIRRAYPALASPPLYRALALFELCVGAMFLLGLYVRAAAAGTVLHVLGTLSVLVVSPATTFVPGFPFLTLDGEFVVKNVVLLASAAALFLRSPGGR